MFPAEIGDIGFPPRALEHYTAALEATVDIEAIRAARFKVVVDYAYGSTSFVMPNVLAKLGADVLGVNPYASTSRCPRLRPGARTPSRSPACVRASGAHLGAVIDPDGEHLTLIDDTGHVLTDERGAARAAHARERPPARRHGRPAGHGHPPRRGHRRRARRAGAAHEARRPPRSMDAASEPGVGFAASTDGGFILPGFLPAFDAAATLVKVLELLARIGHAAVDGGRGAAPHRTSPTRRS